MGASHYNLACVEALAGDTDEAFEHLRDAARAERDRGDHGSPHDTDLDPIRGDPRFPEVLRMNLAHIDELDAIELPDGFVWRPVRRHFEIRAFGVNAYTAREGGRPDRRGAHARAQLEHEEIYLVLRGRARSRSTATSTSSAQVSSSSSATRAAARRGRDDDDAVVLALGGKPGERTRSRVGGDVRRRPDSRAQGRWDEAIASTTRRSRASPTSRPV